MGKINFERLEVFTDIAKTRCVVLDYKKMFADAIYTNAFGIAAHALAMKIYNSHGETEFDDSECDLIRDYAERFGTPAFIDAINVQLNNNRHHEDS